MEAFTTKDFQQRHYHQKDLCCRLPCLPLVKFLLLYLAERSFLDERAGLTCVILQAVYGYFIVLKVRELQAAALKLGDGLPRPAPSR